MGPPPHAVEKALPGWILFWAELEAAAGADARPVLDEACCSVRRTLALETLSADPVVAALRGLFRRAGTDPTRYRVSSEALLRRVLKGEEVPLIHPLVDLNNALSLLLRVPCCVMRRDSFSPPLIWRSGLPGESYESLKGPLNLEGKPLLADADGPLDTPITGSRKVMVRPESDAAWFVAYLPEGVVSPAQAEQQLQELLSKTPGIRVLCTAAT